MADEAQATAKGERSPRGQASPVGETAHIEPAPQNEEEDDPTLGEETLSSTASISSTILEFQTLHGRRYHARFGDIKYWAANDERQLESEELQHLAMTLALKGEFYLAPIDRSKIEKALDIGTGGGLWAVDFADDNPNVEVIGTDISPVQPQWVPPNLRFEIEDFTKEWTFAPESVDYIHLRWLLGSVADWDAFFKEAARTLKSGGIVESHEPQCHIESEDGSVKEDSALAKWGPMFVKAGESWGRPFDIIDKGSDWRLAQECGVEGIGRHSGEAFKRDLEGYALVAAAEGMGWDKEHTQVYAASLRKELADRNIHPVFRHRIVWGRKP
ncbi:hypothetical protein SAPIO_CDS6767 [Scedosporium apiospermum]|uniref:Uncharacterized protein n=1 Tax=Pseudallescheria apiosperma TaxID=563466 RepID=A0A084G374_PSEDA|nr:uncharacterized protein SAPIO_CDS6767 [Scedosporium apiospermum]KEZ41786.1 hypothetical protein SAPIO_CDS6767 [Scedosporium apiospermum]